MRRLGTIVFLSLFVTANVLAQPATEPKGQDSDPYPGGDPHGAVLCVWGLYQLIQIVGEKCFPDEKSEFKNVIDEAIDKIDVFIMKNAPATREEIEKRKAHDREAVGSDSKLCDLERDSPMELYQGARRATPEEIRASVEKLLAIPRKPVMHPCL
jgi:hypothetical protein